MSIDPLALVTDGFFGGSDGETTYIEGPGGRAVVNSSPIAVRVDATEAVRVAIPDGDVAVFVVPGDVTIEVEP